MEFNTLFPDTRLRPETRIAKCQAVMLRMLKIFDFLCNEHQIEYFLIGGSLLGAIRHQGFIPWDDDLDLGMTRANYERFVTEVVPLLPGDIFFQTTETDPKYPACDYVDAKLRDRYSRYTKNKYQYHDGLQLDIFVYDKAFIPSNFFIILQNFLLKGTNNNARRAKVLKWISRTIPNKLVYTCNYLHNWAQLTYGRFFFYKKELTPLIRVKFEDMEVTIPNGWHDSLTRQYGNYMELPPENKRTTHHIEQPEPCLPCDHKESLVWTNNI
ncbi:LicD family protein [Mucilaginibacter boryungensis]|uniref:LicD family protein n=1 Tax=Mucilaginibacter boryungensis TaxID=768480 RepID=A0ABR9XLG5_9SPHI|nr:LicD family protein [Mucilaginibacter boryungensis]MBE9667894.1 LicD family protein [Mucilaginibacter boryungensis]